ncbi:MAG: gluconate 2-dehydrogenase subunit 3 family protein, partial [Acidimicrobiia bacterium]|nr:gluconate 2-dehydrogenase subunit 3 family protein [Acidimicrobiia bacterium]
LDKREPWEVAEHDAVDPVAWGARLEAARERHR